MIVLDSDIVIDALNGRQPSKELVAAGLEAELLAVTAITLFEVSRGGRTSASVSASKRSSTSARSCP